MSRIYEALRKRPGRSGGLDSTEAHQKPVPPARSTSGKALEEYPVEAGDAFDPIAHLDREVARNTSPNARIVTRDLVRIDERRSEAPTQPIALKLVSTVVHQGSLVSLDPGQKLMVDAEVPPAWAESYVDLARTLEETRSKRPLKTLMVTSTQRGEGRTLTAANLALALSERLSRRVLLIDGDVQRPSAGRLFNVSNRFRLSDILHASTRDVPVTDVSPTLSVLGTEPSDADAMTVLVSSAMSTLLKATSHYDWVLIDTPPLQYLPEAHLLSWMGDGVLLVIGAPTTRRKTAQSAVHDLGGRDRIVGVMLNRG